MKVLFVCTGNICRSPTAEGVLIQTLKSRPKLQHVHVDSAGTHGYHVGESPDPRTVAAAKKRGFQLGGLRARKVGAEDFRNFDLMLGMDSEHVSHMRAHAPENATARIELFLEYAGFPPETEVPDPYYGQTKDFELVLDLVEAGVEGLIRKIETGI